MAEITGVRQVQTAGRRIVEVLAAAFANDPWLAWTLPNRGSATVLMSMFLREVALPHGVVLVVGDPIVGVALLLPPSSAVPERPEIGHMVMALHGPLVGRALDADAIIDPHRPAEEGWVLHTLGVDPSVVGTGIGSALLAACLDLAEGRLTLETSSPEAAEWYRRRGFVVSDVVDLSDGHGLPEGAPTIWLLSHGP